MTPNYDAASVAAACRELEASQLECKLMVDSATANSEKKWRTTGSTSARDVGAQVAAGNACIFGVMVESHLNAGAQKFTPGKDDPAALEYGKSITDGCIGWGDSLTVLDVLSDAVKARRSTRALTRPGGARLRRGRPAPTSGRRAKRAGSSSLQATSGSCERASRVLCQ